MAKRKAATKQKQNKKAPQKASSRRAGGKVASSVIDQVKEPLSLLSTLKEEGLANAVAFLGMASHLASGATKNFRMDKMRPQLTELISSLGFATKADVERLEQRIEELEEKASENEYKELRYAHGEEE